MSAIVVNRIALTVPVEQVLPDIEREFPPVFRSLDGFIRFRLVKAGPTEVVVLIEWATPEHAAAGAAVIGPGLFNRYVAPHAASQDRLVGGVVLDVGAQP